MACQASGSNVRIIHRPVALYHPLRKNLHNLFMRLRNVCCFPAYMQFIASSNAKCEPMHKESVRFDLVIAIAICYNNNSK